MTSWRERTTTGRRLSGALKRVTRSRHGSRLGPRPLPLPACELAFSEARFAAVGLFVGGSDGPGSALPQVQVRGATQHGQSAVAPHLFVGVQPGEELEGPRPLRHDAEEEQHQLEEQDEDDDELEEVAS